MTEIVCTCDHAVPEHAPHNSDCPMVTGLGIRNFAGEEDHFLASPEPVLAGVLRARLDDGEIVLLHTDDGGRVGGTIESVSEDGFVVTVVEGRDLFELDVTKIVVVQTLRRGKPPAGA